MNKPDILVVLADHGGQRIPTGKAGWASMPCPYHPDSRASARVNAEAGKFHCHGCGVAGDSIDLIQQYTGTDFKQAMVIAERDYGVTRDTRIARPSTRGRAPAPGLSPSSGLPAARGIPGKPTRKVNHYKPKGY